MTFFTGKLRICCHVFTPGSFALDVLPSFSLLVSILITLYFSIMA
jgi:hypothetical protein